MDRRNGVRRMMWLGHYQPVEIKLKELLTLIPIVAQKLHENEILADFIVLMKGIADGTFPLTNIAFHLLLDVARWYSCLGTRQITYSKETMHFWKIGYKLFHGNFVRFMGGLKNTGQLISNKDNKLFCCTNPKCQSRFPWWHHPSPKD